MVNLVGNESEQSQEALAESAVGPRYITARQLRELIASQDYRCNLTGWELNPKSAQVDHVEPLAKGGAHVLSNLQVVHTSVNTAKGTMTNDEFIEMCCAVADNVRGG